MPAAGATWERECNVNSPRARDVVSAVSAEPSRLYTEPRLPGFAMARLTSISFLGETHHPKVVMGAANNKAADILQGTLELLILRTLANCPLSGNGEIGSRHERMTDGYLVGP